ncbi:MAG: hypothetical protein R2712_26815 [Vicinamibacterales bacterium]
MSTLLYLVVIVAVLFAVSRIVRKPVDARRAQIAGIAAQLGLGGHTTDALGRSTPGPGAHESTRSGDSVAADALTAAWGARTSFHGQWNGRAVSLGALPTSRYRVSIGAQCRLPVDVHLFARSPKASVGGPPTPLPAVTSGDEAFDRAVEVSAKDGARARDLVARAAVRDALRAITTGAHDPRVLDDWVYVVPYDTEVPDADTARRMLDEVVTMADRLDAALG